MKLFVYSTFSENVYLCMCFGDDNKFHCNFVLLIIFAFSSLSTTIILKSFQKITVGRKDSFQFAETHSGCQGLLLIVKGSQQLPWTVACWQGLIIVAKDCCLLARTHSSCKDSCYCAKEVLIGKHYYRNEISNTFTMILSKYQGTFLRLKTFKSPQSDEKIKI